MTTKMTGALDTTTGNLRKDIALRASLRDVAVAALLGLGLVWISGFAGANSLHAAAHDTRHSTGFPCH